MTEKLFWQGAYIKDFEAEVVSVEGNKLVLDRTAFNPRGGGLVSDLGTVNGQHASSLRKKSVPSPCGGWEAEEPAASFSAS